MAKTKNNGRETEYHVWLWNENMDYLDGLGAQRWNGHSERSKILNLILKEHRERLASAQPPNNRKI